MVVQPETFPIPMRGNEASMTHVIAFGPQTHVSDPHEG